MFKGERQGVRVLCSPQSAYTLHTPEGRRMEELYPNEAFWAGLLPAMGVPYAYCSDPAPLAGQVVAAAGQVLRNWSAETLEKLFRNNFVLLTGDALETLCDRGLEGLAGVESARWLQQDSGAFAYEQVSGEREYCGRRHARASAVLVAGDALEVRYAPGAQVEEYTALYDSYRRRAAPCQAVVDGRVLIYPFGHLPEPPAIPPMLLNSVRQAVLQDVLRAANAPFPMVVGQPYLEPYCFCDGAGLHLYLVNAATDPVDRAALAMRSAPEQVRAFCSHRGEAERLPCRAHSGGVWVPLALPSMETALLTFSSSPLQEDPT